MPLGNLGICSLEGDDRAIVRGWRQQKAILLLHPLCPFFYSSPFLSISFFTSPSEAFSGKWWQPLKRQKAKAHVCLFHLINFNTAPLYHTQKSHETILAKSEGVGWDCALWQLENCDTPSGSEIFWIVIIWLHLSFSDLEGRKSETWIKYEKKKKENIQQSLYYGFSLGMPRDNLQAFTYYKLLTRRHCVWESGWPGQILLLQGSSGSSGEGKKRCRGCQGDWDAYVTTARLGEYDRADP